MEQWMSLVQSGCNHIWTVSHRETCSTVCGVCLIVSCSAAWSWGGLQLPDEEKQTPTGPDRLSSHATNIQSMPVWRKFRGELFCLHACRSQWKCTVFLFPIVLAQPGAILAWQCGDVSGTVLASGLDISPACVPCAVLFCRGKTPKEIC